MDTYNAFLYFSAFLRLSQAKYHTINITIIANIPPTIAINITKY